MIPAVSVMAGAGTLVVIRQRGAGLGWARVADLLLVGIGSVTLLGLEPRVGAVIAGLLLVTALFLALPGRLRSSHGTLALRVITALSIAMSAELVLVRAVFDSETAVVQSGVVQTGVAVAIAASDTVMLVVGSAVAMVRVRAGRVRVVVEIAAMLAVTWSLMLSVR